MYEKIYPPLEPSAPIDDQVYRLKKVEELEKFLRSEIEKREQLAKKFKRYGTTTRLADTLLVATTVITGGGSIASLSTGIGLPVSIALASITLVLSLSTVFTRKTIKIVDTKSKKHDQIRLLAESKLDSISDAVSQAIQDGDISPDEYQRILKEIEHYRQIKQQIRQKTKRVTDAINEEQRQAILDQGRKEGKEDFLRQIANTSGILPSHTCRLPPPKYDDL